LHKCNVRNLDKFYVSISTNATWAFGQMQN